MVYQTLIAADELARRLDDPEWGVFDCRFSLADREVGRRAYLQAHIPGAVYAHLDEDLCGEIIPGKTGRHPLPPVETFVRTVSRWGIHPGVQVVAYDDQGGAMAAARLWWMLRWLGHEAVAVLDGGWQSWLAAGLPVRGGNERRPASKFQARPRPEMVANTAEVESKLAREQELLVDSRAFDRYCGENETIDPVAGHIPGAVSAPYQDNLDEDGEFLPEGLLRSRFQQVIGGFPAGRVIFYCGSGVTAAQNVLALAHSGLGEARLYDGSWSEWITAPGRPIATGERPG